MEPDYNYKPTPAKPKVSRRTIVLVAAGLILLAISLGLMYLANRSDETIPDPGYKLSETSLMKSANLSVVQGKEIYSYNGLAFYKISLEDGKITTLRSGIKLPVPRSAIWSPSDGVLLTFKNAFGGTVVEELLRAQNLRLNKTTENYTWHLDFATGSLTIASTQPLDPEAATYSAATRGFYYMARDETTIEDKTTLHFFDTQTKTDKSFANPGLVTVSGLAACDDYQVCFKARSADNSAEDKLYALDKSNKITVLHNSKGRIFSTGNPNYFVSSENTDTDNPKQTDSPYTDNQHEGPENTDYTPAPAKLYDIKQKALTELGFDIGNLEINLGLTSDTDFYAFETSYTTDYGDSTVSAYRAGILRPGNQTVTTLFPLLINGSEGFNGSIILASHGKGVSLVTDNNGRQLLFSTDTNPPNLKARSQEAVSKVINDCKNKNTNTTSTYYDNTKMFRIEVTDDANFKANIAKFSTCVAEKGDTAFIGYAYSFAGLDPVTGRLTTD